ncbi:hypothetical protein BV210_12420 [Halorientalis sp. IM1011]|uniref:hypothetical protein n=1 Tax=Halorientalis sp. IM1011 TaxID=1932360 RepID=UPI00097CC4EE|nr:hypothetical protein [Halorientalis sp. IM1011]AQL43444.1 hypothetical protein BV210_12420 [Halorientalis sp. IM1011]
MLALPLQVIDNFLLQYNVGQALLLIFILSALAALPLKSQRVYAMQFLGFGLLFLLTPQSMLEATYWKFLGLALLVLAPMVYMTAKR